MALDVKKELKINFILGFIVLIYYGLWLFISYESWVAVHNWPLFDPAAGRYLGGVFIAWALIALKVLRELDNWEKVENWIIFSVIVNILGLISFIISIIFYTTNPIGIINLIIAIFFAALGIHILIQKRKEK
ncbi:MAG: hypothetical protein ACFE8A_02470 [Candidatus Hodarchaeota archaeon]